jgi:hypothetical protein
VTHKTGAHRAFLGMVKMTSDIAKSRTFVFKSKILWPIVRSDCTHGKKNTSSVSVSINSE